MATGGTTWDTAGTLDLGFGNTFTVADATENGTGSESWAHDLAWWTFTPTTSQRATRALSPNAFAVLFRGETFATRDDVSPVDFDVDDNAIYELSAGETYHLMVAWFFVEPVTYTVGYTKIDALYSPWFTLPDNYLIVSNEGYALQATNPAPYDTWQTWMHKVIRRFSGNGPTRAAQFSATEVFGGDDPNAAASCCWMHARHGELAGQYWNGGGGAGDTSPGVCEGLHSTPAGHTSGLFPYYGVEPAGPPPELFEAREQIAAIGTSARALFYGPVGDNVGPGGTGFPPTAEEAGYPAAIGGEWEGGEGARPKLLSVEFTTDAIDRSDPPPSADDSMAVVLYAAVKPPGYTVDVTLDTNGTYADWPIGVVDDTPDVGHSAVEVDHWLGGDPTYHTITGAVAGADGWANANDYTSEGPGPDEMAVLTMWTPFNGDSPTDGSHGPGPYDIALRFKLRPRRWRFILGYGETPRSFPPRRGTPRHNATTAARGVGGRDDIQSGPRGIGGVV